MGGRKKADQFGDQFRADLAWWKAYAKFFNGTAAIVDTSVDCINSIMTDASLTGYGVCFKGDWLGGYFNSFSAPEDWAALLPAYNHWVNIFVPQNHCGNINVLEMVPVYLAAHRYGALWVNSKVLLISDNTQVVGMINKGVSSNKFCMKLLRGLFWCSALFNFHLTATHISGEDNCVPDYLSRIPLEGSVFGNGFEFLCCSLFKGAR